jgi:hypothetical protein
VQFTPHFGEAAVVVLGFGNEGKVEPLGRGVLFKVAEEGH